MPGSIVTKSWSSQPRINSNPATVQEIVREAKQRGGFLASWRINRSSDQAAVTLAGDALRAYFEAKREELFFRTSLALDEAKKRAIADNLADTAEIEREISRMTTSIMCELEQIVSDTQESIMLAEAKRLDTLDKHVKAGLISEHRRQQATGRMEIRVNGLMDRVEVMAERVTANLGDRLENALRVNMPLGGGGRLLP